MSKREELYKKITEEKIEHFAKIDFNKHYTNCSNEELEFIVKEYAENSNDCSIEDVLSQEDTEESKVFHLTVSEEEYKNVLRNAEEAIWKGKEAIEQLETFLNIVKSWETD